MPETKKHAVKGKASKKRSRKKRKKTGFIRYLWDWLMYGYDWAINPEHKELLKMPRLFGRTVTYAGMVVCLMVLIVLVTVLLNNRAVGVDHETLVVTGLPSDFEGYQILVISDLNGRTFGEKQSTLMRKLDSESYNCVVYLGDMIGPSGKTQAFFDLIEQIGTRKPSYFIAGDSDPSPLLTEPRDNSTEALTLKNMVLADWVLEAEELGVTYVDIPVKLTKNESTMWIMPDTFLNLDLTQALEEYKDELEQESESYLEGIEKSKNTLPLTTYRRNQLFKAQEIIGEIGDDDILLMLSHEAPSDNQLIASQKALEGDDIKNFFTAPDVVLCGHYCGGEWKFPIIGTLYAQSNILPRYGWFPDESYVSGQRSVNGTIVYTTVGLGNNSATLLKGRLNNPPRVSIITLTGELPASFLE